MSEDYSEFQKSASGYFNQKEADVGDIRLLGQYAQRDFKNVKSAELNHLPASHTQCLSQEEDKDGILDCIKKTMENVQSKIDEVSSLQQNFERHKDMLNDSSSFAKISRININNSSANLENRTDLIKMAEADKEEFITSARTIYNYQLEIDNTIRDDASKIQNISDECDEMDKLWSDAIEKLDEQEAAMLKEIEQVQLEKSKNKLVLLEENSKLELLLDQLNQEIPLKDARLKNFDDVKESITRMTEEIGHKRPEMEIWNDKILTLQTTIRNVEEKNRQEYTNIAEELKRIDEIIEEITKELNQEKNLEESIEKERNNKEEQLKCLENNMTDTNAELDTLSSRHGDIIKRLVELEEGFNEEMLLKGGTATRMQSELKCVEAMYHDVKNSNETQENNNKSNDSDVVKLEESVKTLEESRSTVLVEDKVLITKKEEVHAIELVFQNLKEQRDAKLMIKQEEIKKIITDLEDNNRNSSERIDDLRKELDDIQARHEKLEKQKEQSTTRLQDLENVKKAQHKSKVDKKQPGVAIKTEQLAQSSKRIRNWDSVSTVDEDYSTYVRRSVQVKSKGK